MNVQPAIEGISRTVVYVNPRMNWPGSLFWILLLSQPQRVELGAPLSVGPLCATKKKESVTAYFLALFSTFHFCDDVCTEVKRMPLRWCKQVLDVVFVILHY